MKIIYNKNIKKVNIFLCLWGLFLPNYLFGQINLSGTHIPVTIGTSSRPTLSNLSLRFASSLPIERYQRRSGLHSIFYNNVNVSNLSSGQVSFATSPSTIGGDASLFWNNTSKRLGVGTGSPTARLHVQAQGALASDVIFRVSNSANTFDIIRALGDGNVFVGLGAGNVNKGRGNTGFGIEALHVNTTGYFNTANGNLALFSNTSGYQNTANGSYALFSNTRGGNNTANGALTLRNNTTGAENTANGVQALFSNTTGNNNTANGNRALYSNTTGGNNIANGGQAGDLIATGASLTIADNSVFLGAGTRALSNNQTNQIVIGHNAIGLGSNTAVLGNNSITFTGLKGNVGIGTTTDEGYRLDVNGTARIVGATRVDNLAGEGIRMVIADENGVMSTQVLGIAGSGTTNFLPKFTDFRSVGNSGIFETAEGNIGTGGNTTPAFAIETQGSGFRSGYAFKDISFNSYFAMTSSNNGSFQIADMNKSGGATRLMVFNEGNVGINTITDAGFRLDVNGTARIVGATKIDNLAGEGIRMVVADANGVMSTQVLGIAGSGTTNFLPKFTDVGTVGNSGIFETAEGNIGTGGNATPAFALETQGSGFSSGFAFKDTSSNSYFAMTSSNNGSFQIADMNKSGGATRLMVFNEGNVGINTITDAGFRLDVNGTARIVGATKIDNLAGEGIRMVVADANGVMSTQAIGSGASGTPNYLAKFTDDVVLANSAIYESGGNVGIGTANPQYSLAVNGIIGAKEVNLTATGWADYVFRPEYTLRPLSELEAFINKNGHLPNVPSEKEVLENGVNLLEMNIKLLEKVEELTLYLIEMKKEIEELRALQKK